MVQFWSLPSFFRKYGHMTEPKRSVVRLTVPKNPSQTAVEIFASDGSPVEQQIYQSMQLDVTCRSGTLVVARRSYWTGGGESARTYVWTDENQMKKLPNGGIVVRHELRTQGSFFGQRSGSIARGITYYLVSPAKSVVERLN